MIAFGGVLTALLAATHAAAEHTPSEAASKCMQLPDKDARHACMRKAALTSALGEASGEVSSVLFTDMPKSVSEIQEDGDLESTVPNRALLRERRPKDRSRRPKQRRGSRGGHNPHPAPPMEPIHKAHKHHSHTPPPAPEVTTTGSCGLGGQPVCSGDQMTGRDFECDFGFIGHDGLCIPYEEKEAMNTPTPPPDPIPTPTGDGSIPPPMEDVSIPPPMEDGSIPPPMEDGSIPPPMEDGSIPPPMEDGSIPPPAPETPTDTPITPAVAQRMRTIPLPQDPPEGFSFADPNGGNGTGPFPALTSLPKAPPSEAFEGAGQPTGDVKGGHITWFDAMGIPFGGCGIPGDRMTDDNGKIIPFVALNTNSYFANGANCGRWIEVTLNENCQGGYNSQWSPCNGREFQHDELSGSKIYGYITDSCADPNFWCQNDPGHLDFSTEYLNSLGLVGEHMNGRLATWQFLDGVAPGYTMNKLKYMWMEGSRWLDNSGGFFAALIIYNTPNGIDGVEMFDKGEWKAGSQVTNLGNVWEMPEPADYAKGTPAVREFTIRVKDMSGGFYPEETIPWPCGNQPCVGNVDV